MSVGPSEAAVALGDVARSRHRAAELRGYAGTGNALIVWGVVWLIGYTTAQFAPDYAGWVWTVGVAGGIAYSMFAPRRRPDPRIFATGAMLFGFFALAGAILRPSPIAQAVLISLIVAAAYVGFGIWSGPRYAWLGLTLAAVIALGWFVLPAWLPLCLALGGGGTLVAGGLWLRQA